MERGGGLMWATGKTEVVWTVSRISFDGDGGMRLCLHRSADELGVPCAGVHQESCLGLSALVRHRRHRGRSDQHDGCSYGRWVLCHRSVFCAFGLGVGEKEGRDQE